MLKRKTEFDKKKTCFCVKLETFQTTLTPGTVYFFLNYIYKMYHEYIFMYAMKKLGASGRNRPVNSVAMLKVSTTVKCSE